MLFTIQFVVLFGLLYRRDLILALLCHCTLLRRSVAAYTEKIQQTNEEFNQASLGQAKDQNHYLEKESLT